MSLRALVLVGLTIGCNGAASAPDGGPDLAHAHDLAVPPPFCVDGADGGPPPTLASVEHITAMSCLGSGCHSGADPFTQFKNLDLRPGHVYASVVNVPASESCGGVRVVPGDPSKSYLLQKVADAMPCSPPDAGFLQMPRCEDGSCPIPKCQIEIIRAWIAAGAPQ